MWEARMPTSVSRERGIHLRRTASVADLRQETLTSLLAVLPHLREGALLEDVRALANQHTGWILARQGRCARHFDGESTLHADGLRAITPSAGAPSTGAVTARDQERWLAERVEQLDPDQAAVVRLRLEGREFEEIGRELGIPAAPRRSSACRGRT